MGWKVFWETRSGLRAPRINFLYHLEASAIPTSRFLLILHHRVRSKPDDLKLLVALRLGSVYSPEPEFSEPMRENSKVFEKEREWLFGGMAVQRHKYDAASL